MNNTSEFLSKENWLLTAAVNASDAVMGRKNGIPSLWWKNHEVRIFWERGISQVTVELIKKACEERMEECGLFVFNFQLCGEHPSNNELIQQSITRQGHINDERLSNLCLHESWRDENNGGRQHGDIIITKRQLVDDPVSWAVASTLHGMIVFALYGERQHNHSFLFNVAKHEFAHMLGLMWHCDEHKNVEGYHYSPNCNMHYACNVEYLCPKCRDFIFQWWTQVDHISNL